jgi:hypothetical protein
VFGMQQLCRKAVAFLPPSSEFLASSHYSEPRIRHHSAGTRVRPIGSTT